MAINDVILQIQEKQEKQRGKLTQNIVQDLHQFKRVKSKMRRCAQRANSGNDVNLARYLHEKLSFSNIAAP